MFLFVAGVILGLLLAVVCIGACVSCLLLRRRCLKRRALARARLITTNNYYRPPITTAHETSLGVQLETSCSAEAHEMQQLMTEECPRHIPQSTSTHLDTKVKKQNNIILTHNLCWRNFLGGCNVSKWPD